MEKINTNIGFNGEVFLTKEQWDTYRKRMPVRYISKKKKGLCDVCGEQSKENNPIQNAHKIGFGLGILYLGLTPEYVDEDENIMSAHRTKCNKSVELDLEGSCRQLKNAGIIKLPNYLPAFVHSIWNKI